RASYSRAGRPAELSVWLRHLLANAALRGERGPLETRLTTRPPKGNGVRQVRLRAPENPDALLAPLIRLFRQGRDSPLAFWPEEARAYVEALRDEKKGGSEQAALEQALKIRSGEFWRPDPYESLLERGGDGDPLESPEFREGARAVFEPFLQHLEPTGDES
ncbi:MAG: hypothetical protein J4G09_05035, partial [Proteobacteria bacterium]|nr:hypothetical protein [Pseudomonadota bacterium]